MLNLSCFLSYRNWCNNNFDVKVSYFMQDTIFTVTAFCFFCVFFYFFVCLFHRWLFVCDEKAVSFMTLTEKKLRFFFNKLLCFVFRFNDINVQFMSPVNKQKGLLWCSNNSVFSIANLAKLFIINNCKIIGSQYSTIALSCLDG